MNSGERAGVCMLVKNQLWNDARVKKEAACLAGCGFSVTVIGKPEDGCPEEEYWNGVRVLRPRKDTRVRDALRQRVLRATEPGKSSIPARILRTIRRNPIRRFLTDLKRDLPWEYRLYRAVLSTNARIVHANDLDTLLVAALAARRLKARLVYDSHELWLESTRYLRETGPLNRLRYRLLERRLIRRADAVIAVTPSRGRAMAEMYPEVAERITIVENSSEPIPDLPPGGMLREELGLAGGIPIILYQGIICPERGLEELLQAAALLPGDSAAIVIIGHDSWGGHLERMHRQLGLDGRVFLLPPVPSERLPEVTVSADAGLILFRNTCLNHYYSLPNKLYEYMMAGLPIIASDLPEMRRVIEESRCGVLIQSPEPEAIAEAILAMISSPVEMRAMGDRGRTAALSLYNWSVQAERLMELYRGLAR